MIFYSQNIIYLIYELIYVNNMAIIEKNWVLNPVIIIRHFSSIIHH